MPYTTLAQLEARYGQDEIARLTDRTDPPLGAADAAVVAEKILEADSEIDGYIGSVTVLPLAVVPELIKNLSCTIARYRLYEDQATERVRVDYEDAVRMLRDLAAGKMVLFSGSTEITTSKVVVRAPDQVFTDDLLAMT